MHSKTPRLSATRKAIRMIPGITQEMLDMTSLSLRSCLGQAKRIPHNAQELPNNINASGQFKTWSAGAIHKRTRHRSQGSLPLEIGSLVQKYTA